MIDREWEDGDDSALEDKAYSDGFSEGRIEGIRQAYDYVVDELGFELSDSDILERLGAK